MVVEVATIGRVEPTLGLRAAGWASGGGALALAAWVVLAAWNGSPYAELLDHKQLSGISLSTELFALVKGLHREGMTVVMVEQNALDALEIADRGYLLVDGSNAREGQARALAADAEVRHAFLGG